MSFKSREQQKAVMAILRGKKRKLVMYHSTPKPLPRRLKANQPLHAGTTHAAIERLTETDARYLYELHVPVTRKNLLLGRMPKDKRHRRLMYWRERNVKAGDKLSHGKRLFGEEAALDPYLNFWFNSAYEAQARRRRFLKAAARLKKTVVPYINDAEDKGSVSYALLQPHKQIARRRLLVKLPKRGTKAWRNVMSRWELGVREAVTQEVEARLARSQHKKRRR